MAVFLKLIVLLLGGFSLIACTYFKNLNSVTNLHDGITDFRAQNYRDAFIHLKPEAQKGQRDAQYAVAWMYYYGQGILEDRRRALIWMSRAASAGQVDAIKALEILTHTPVEHPLSSEPPIMNEL